MQGEDDVLPWSGDGENVDGLVRRAGRGREAVEGKTRLLLGLVQTNNVNALRDELLSRDSTIGEMASEIKELQAALLEARREARREPEPSEDSLRLRRLLDDSERRRKELEADLYASHKHLRDVEAARARLRTLLAEEVRSAADLERLIAELLPEEHGDLAPLQLRRLLGLYQAEGGELRGSVAARIEALREELGLHERVMLELSKTVHAQARIIEALTRERSLLHARIDEAAQV